MTKKQVNGIGSGMKFGFELEFTNASRDARSRIAAHMVANGIMNFRQHDGYSHSSGREWDLKLDGSAGSEIASPILIGQAGLDEAKKVTTLLADILETIEGPVDHVSSRCGMHVHVDVNHLTPAQLGTFLRLWHKFESTIFSLVPASRRSNSYCQMVRRYMRNEDDFAIFANGWSRLSNPTDRVRRWTSTFGRYTSINLDHYNSRGTIEFRLFGGTTDASKVIGNILLCLRLVQCAVEMKKVSWKSKATKTSALEMMLYGLNLYGKVTLDDNAITCRNFIRARWAKFNMPTRNAGRNRMDVEREA